MVEAAPAASFEVAQPEFLFQFLVIAFDDPALFCLSDKIAQPDGFGQIGQPVFARFSFAAGPLDRIRPTKYTVDRVRGERVGYFRRRAA